MIRGNAVAASPISKVRRLPDGRLVGVVGTAAEGMAYARWLEAGGEGDAPPLDDSSVIEVAPDGSGIVIHECGGWYETGPANFHAWGSGAAAALGALWCGATAVQAVEAACQVDPGSGGAVQSVSLQRPELRAVA